MKPELLPAIMLSMLSLACIIVILTGLGRLLVRTGWDRRKQQAVMLRVTAFIFAWIMLVGLLAIRGFFSNFSQLPPRPMFVILLPLPFIIWAAYSPAGTALLRVCPPYWLIAMQSFRIIVELLLWRAVVLQLLPVAMSFEGNNFDIVSGILAIVVAVLIRRKWSRGLVIAYNIIGLGLLLNILVIAVLCMPTPLRYFKDGPPNTLVATFPFIYLPAVLVVIAYAFHVFSLRQLRLLKK